MQPPSLIAVADIPVPGQVRPSELGELLAGSAAGRSSQTDITVATLAGLGVQDLVAAEVALSRLRAAT